MKPILILSCIRPGFLSNYSRDFLRQNFCAYFLWHTNTHIICPTDFILRRRSYYYYYYYY